MSYKQLHGADPQLYNIYGTMASVVPLFNGNHAFQGVAIVPIENVQEVAVGTDQYSALREYEMLISNHGERIALDSVRDLLDAVGIVDRFGSEVKASGNIYYFHIAGIPHIFTSSSGDLPKLTVTKVGDRVRISYFNSLRDVLPLQSFDNLSLVLSESRAQSEVRNSVRADQDSARMRSDSATLEERFRNLTPEQRRRLLKQSSQ